MASSLPAQGISAPGVGSPSAESYVAPEVASSAGAVEPGSPSASQNESLRTTRASTLGVASTIDPEVEDPDEQTEEHVGPSAGHPRSSPGPAALNTTSTLQNSSTPTSYSPENPDPTTSSYSDLASPDSTSSDPIDMDTLLQILDLDEEDNHDFSRGMAWAYFEQAASTFGDMNKAFAQSSLPTLSSLGHFLKGSSAALGVHKVQRSCEQIQHYGELRDEEHNVDLGEEEALRRIGQVLTRVKTEYAEAEKWLKAYFAKLD